jgi:D-alanine-D-alanine ligase
MHIALPHHKTKVAVLAGGMSPERAVSLRSAESVVNALNEADYEVIQIDPASYSGTELLKALKGTDVVFPVLHGAGGEDGTIQAWLEKHHFTYIGADETASKLCFDKWEYKQALMRAGMPVPQGTIVTPVTMWSSPLVNGPFVVKPHDGGSSVDTFIARSPEFADKEGIDAALQKYGTMLLEELIEGREITVGILTDEVLPVVEIVPPADGEFDYENKYNGKSLELCPPRSVEYTSQKEAQDFAMYIHKTLGVRDMSRTDMMVRFEDNAIFILETNTIPGMTDQSLLPKAASAAGHGMVDIVAILVDAALSRRAR